MHTAGLEDLARALSAIGQRERHNLVELGEFDLRTRKPARQRDRSLTMSTQRHGIEGCKNRGRSSEGIVAYILEDNQRAIDAADGVVPNPRHDGVGLLARVTHGGQGSRSGGAGGGRGEDGSRRRGRLPLWRRGAATEELGGDGLRG